MDDVVERAMRAWDIEYQAAIRRAPSNRKGQGVSAADVTKARTSAMRAALDAAQECDDEAEHMEMASPCPQCGEVYELDDLMVLPHSQELACEDCWSIDD